MAKNSNKAALTPREQALENAVRVVDFEHQKSNIEAEIKALKQALENYYNETGERDFGVLTIEVRQSKPKIDFGEMTPKQRKFMVEQLLQDLPEYASTTTDLDVEKLYFAMSTSAAVQNALKVRNLSIHQDSTIAFKKATQTD